MKGKMDATNPEIKSPSRVIRQVGSHASVRKKAVAFKSMVHVPLKKYKHLLYTHMTHIP